MQAFEGFVLRGFDVVEGLREGVEDGCDGAKAFIRVDANLSRNELKSSVLIAAGAATVEVLAAAAVALEVEVRRWNVAGMVP